MWCASNEHDYVMFRIRRRFNMVELLRENTASDRYIYASSKVKLIPVVFMSNYMPQFHLWKLHVAHNDSLLCLKPKWNLQLQTKPMKQTITHSTQTNWILLNFTWKVNKSRTTVERAHKKTFLCILNDNWHY